MIDRGTKRTESPAPAPDPVCANCGHRYGHHWTSSIKPDGGVCEVMQCGCTAFVPTAEPAPLDPVLVERAEAMYICWMGEPWPRPALSGADEFKDLPQGARVRWVRLAEAYGRDGAR